jgi:hypothetical protein
MKKTPSFQKASQSQPSIDQEKVEQCGEKAATHSTQKRGM